MAPIFTASSRTSRRRSPLRAALSGPWQAKQFSARIGRMSRLNVGWPAGAANRRTQRVLESIARQLRGRHGCGIRVGALGGTRAIVKRKGGPLQGGDTGFIANRGGGRTLFSVVGWLGG